MNIDLSTWEGYDLACGLRGPDYVGYLSPDIVLVKWVFPARIRFFVGVSERRCSVRERRVFRGDGVDTFEEYEKGATKVGRHFFSHVGRALSILMEQADATETSEEMSLLIDLAQATFDYLGVKNSVITGKGSLPELLLLAGMEEAWNKLIEFCEGCIEVQDE